MRAHRQWTMNAIEYGSIAIRNAECAWRSGTRCIEHFLMNTAPTGGMSRPEMHRARVLRVCRRERGTHHDEDGLLSLVEQLRDGPHVVVAVDVPTNAHFTNCAPIQSERSRTI